MPCPACLDLFSREAHCHGWTLESAIHRLAAMGSGFHAEKPPPVTSREIASWPDLRVAIRLGNLALFAWAHPPRLPRAGAFLAAVACYLESRHLFHADASVVVV